MSPVSRTIAISIGLTLGAGVVAFGVGAPPERCPDITVADARGAATAAVGWIVDNQQADGRWLYEYDRVADSEADDYNIVRHAGLMSALYQAAARGYDGAFDSADRGLAYAVDHLVERADWAGVTTSDTLQTGTNALVITALVERRLFTGDDSYDDLMAKLGRFLTSQVQPNGSLLAYYDLVPDQPRADTYSIYYTGEVYWALGRLHRLDPSAGWGAIADRMGQYMGTVRDDAEEIWPPLADHWSGYGLAETAAFPERPVGRPLTETEVEYVRRLGGLIGQRVRSISQRFGPWGVYVRGTFTPRGGGYGVFGEGLAGLWRAAHLDDRLADDRGTIGERAVCITGLAIEAQVTADEANEYADPGKVEGAWFIDDLTRMDDQQHALERDLDDGSDPRGRTHKRRSHRSVGVVMVDRGDRRAQSDPRRARYATTEIRSRSCRDRLARRPARDGGVADGRCHQRLAAGSRRREPTRDASGRGRAVAVVGEYRSGQEAAVRPAGAPWRARRARCRSRCRCSLARPWSSRA